MGSKAVIRLLKEINFDGYVSKDALPPRPDLRTFLRQTITFPKEIENIVDLEVRPYR